MSDFPTAQTAYGVVRGRRVGRTAVFFGLPYGTGVSGRDRFSAARKPRGWTDVRDAGDHGPRAPQTPRPASLHQRWYRSTGPMDEECLRLNVHAPWHDRDGHHPVMVYLHGGGFREGGVTGPGIRGENLAALGDVVVVTLHHRLSVFGHLFGDHLAPGAFPHAANNGILDIVLALRWIEENIGAFGGDATNVTLFGESGGGSKVAALMALPAAQGCFHKAIIQSSSSLLRMATKVEAADATDALLSELDLPKRRIETLVDVPVARLLEARDRATERLGGIDNFSPVLDEVDLPQHPFWHHAPATSATIPLLIGNCATETAFHLGGIDEWVNLERSRLVPRVAALTGVEVEVALTAVAAMADVHPEATPYELAVRISSHHRYIRNCHRAARLKAAQQGAAVYAYLLNWRTSSRGGRLMSPHTMDVPFVFGTFEAASALLGNRSGQQQMARQVVHAWSSFARSGVPRLAAGPEWPVYGERRRTMVLDDTCSVVDDVVRPEREALADIPLYEAPRAPQFSSPATTRT